MKITLADFVGTASAEPQLVSVSAGTPSVIKGKIESLTAKYGRMKEKPQTPARKERMGATKVRISELKAELKIAEKEAKGKPAKKSAKAAPKKAAPKKSAKAAPKTTKGKSHKNPEFILDKKVDKATKTALSHIHGAVGGENEIYYQRAHAAGPTGTLRFGKAPIDPKKIAGLSKKLKSEGFKESKDHRGSQVFEKDGVKVELGEHYFKEDGADGSKLMTISMPMNKNPAWKSAPRGKRTPTLYD